MQARLQQIIFISLISICLPALAAAEDGAPEGGGAGESLSALEAPARVDGGVELESGGKWRSDELGGLNHNLILAAGWRPFGGSLRHWRLGVDSEALLTSSASDPGGFLDTELTIARTGISLGSLGELTAASLTILPTYQAEREAGMQLAQGAILAWGLEPGEGMGVELELKGSRFLREEARAASVAVPAVEATEEAPATPEVLAAAGADRWRLEEKLTLSYELMRKLGAEASAKHGSGWKWFGGREDLLTLEQKLTYEIDAGWTLGIGHRNETRLLAQDGVRRRVALFRPDESKLYGTLAWEL